jgi:hypothetical protein
MNRPHGWNCIVCLLVTAWLLCGTRSNADQGATVLMTPLASMQESLSATVSTITHCDPPACPLGRGWDGPGGNNAADSTLAVGPEHVVTVTNESFEIFDKAGTTRWQTTWPTFWSVLPPPPVPPAENGMLDPHVIFDQATQRWFIVMLGISTDNLGNATAGWHLIAVSSNANPTQAWTKFRIDAQTFGNTGISGHPDFPSISVDSDALYVSERIQGVSPNSNHLRAYRKSDLLTLSSQILTSELIDIGYTYVDPDPNNQFVHDLQAARASGTPQAPFFVAMERTPRVGRLGHGSRMSIFAARRLFNTGVGQTPYLEKLAVPVTTPAEPLYYDPPHMPQGGSSCVRNDLCHAASAVWRNSRLYVVHSVNAIQQAPGGACASSNVRWYEVDTSGWSLGSPAAVLADSGTIGGGGLGRLFPSVAVNGCGQVVIAYVHGSDGSSGPLENASSCLALRHPGGCFREYNARSLSPTGAELRDYTGAVVDPTDDKTFWTDVPYGANQSNYQDWIQSFLPPCGRADVNGDGVVNIQDFLDFLVFYSAGDLRADLDCTGAVNIQDYLAFLNAYAEGCPACGGGGLPEGGDPPPAESASRGEPSEPSRADLNQDGVVDVADLVAFLELFATSETTADWNGDGAWNADDLTAFMQDFAGL